jgi:hypothetical protein
MQGSTTYIRLEQTNTKPVATRSEWSEWTRTGPYLPALLYSLAYTARGVLKAQGLAMGMATRPAAGDPSDD